MKQCIPIVGKKAGATVPSQKKKFLTAERKGKIFAYAFIAYPVIQFLIFYVWVNINSILMSFQTYKGVNENGVQIYAWGFENFRRLFSDFTNAASSIRVGLANTLKYFAMNIFLMFPISVFISYFLYKRVWGYKIFRVVFLLPGMMSGVVFVSMFKIMISEYGLVYSFLEKVFGYEMPILLNNEKTATATIMAFVFWTGLTGNMILYQGAMNRVPGDVIEVGKLEGIKWYRELWSVVLPMIWPTISMTIITTFTGIFSAGGPILLFSEQGGGMGGNGTMTLPFYIYLQTWMGTSYEYPAAIGLFFTLCAIPIVSIVRFVVNKFDPEVDY